MGTEGTENQLAQAGEGYENITVYSQIERPAVVLGANLREQTQPGVEAADFVDGLIVALDLMHERTQKKKYTKTIYIITAAAYPVGSIDDLESVCERLTETETKLVVVGVDFAKSSGPDSVAVKTEGGASMELEDTSEGDQDQDQAVVKAENDQLLRQIVGQLCSTGSEDLGELIPASELVMTMNGLQTKQVKSAKKKVVLDIQGSLIDICVFTRAKSASAPTLKEEHSAAFDPQELNSGSVKQDVTLRKPDDPDGEVPFEHMIYGYRYGKDYVPVQDTDREAMKFMTDMATMTLLCFAARKGLGMHLSIGDQKCVIPSAGNARSEACIDGLYRALEQTSRIAVVRYVYQKNAEPKLCCLQPDKDCSYKRLL